MAVHADRRHSDSYDIRYEGGFLHCQLKVFVSVLCAELL